MFGNEQGGHRLAMLDPNMKEIGIGEATGQVVPFGQPAPRNAVVITENFGVSGTQSFLTGAVYNDTKVADHFYSLGEGVQNVTATVKNAAGTVVGSDVTGSGGGWSVGEPGGTYTVTFSGGGLGAPVSATVEGGNLNAKVDLVNGTEIDSPASTTLGNGGIGLRLLGIGNIIGTGNALANVIVGNAGGNILAGGGGNDSIDGAAGDDTAVFSGLRSNYQITVTGNSARLVDMRGGSPDGTDTIANIEHVRFADATVNFADLRTTVAPTGSVAINDVFISEGNSGTKVATFTVTRTGGSAAFDVNYATFDGIATTAGGDYVSKNGLLHFDAGVNTQTILDRDQWRHQGRGATRLFKVLLSGATNGGTIADGEVVSPPSTMMTSRSPSRAGGFQW